MYRTILDALRPLPLVCVILPVTAAAAAAACYSYTSGPPPSQLFLMLLLLRSCILGAVATLDIGNTLFCRDIVVPEEM